MPGFVVMAPAVAAAMLRAPALAGMSPEARAELEAAARADHPSILGAQTVAEMMARACTEALKHPDPDEPSPWQP